MKNDMEPTSRVDKKNFLKGRLSDWWYLKRARFAAKKYGLDFENRCCFRHQVSKIGYGLKNGDGEIVLVPMKSGKTAKYKVTSSRYSVTSNFSGEYQKNWFWEFQGYER